MTEKRFTIEVLDKNNWLIEDTKTGENANPIDGTTNVLKGLISTLNKFNDENEQLRKDLIDHSALISMLEDYQALQIEETLWNLTGAKSEDEFNELYKPYLDKAKRSWGV